MKRILRMRQHGKTYDCIKYALEQNAIVVVPYISDIKFIEKESIRNFGREVKCISMNDIVSGRLKGSHREKYIFDDLDRCIDVLIRGNEMIGYSLNMGEENLKCHLKD